MPKLLEVHRYCGLARAVADQLEAADTQLSAHPELEAERGWLSEARARLEPLVRAWSELEDEVLPHPELHSLHPKLFRARREIWSAALFALHEELEAIGGSTSPLIEVVFKDLKLASSKRMKAPAVVTWVGEIEKRLDSSYALRLLGEEERYASAAPLGEALRRSGRSLLVVAAEPEALEPEAASELAERLEAFADRVRVPLAQARALMDAATAPLPSEG